jgi:hypothetical protein
MKVALLLALVVALANAQSTTLYDFGVSECQGCLLSRC